MIKKGFALLLMVLFFGMISGCTPKPEEVDLDDLHPRNDIYYQLFVRSFADSDSDGIGDFKGITENLPYLKELGIGGIWLLPIHPSPSYHGYDVSDYYAVNPEYGTMDDFEELIKEADKLGIRIMIDLVLNHSSTENEWFQKSMAGNPNYRDWYVWIDSTSPRKSAVGSWNQTLFHGTGSSLYAGYFSHTMPDFNVTNPVVIEEFNNIGRFWLEKGVTGFRLDAALHFFGTNEYVGITDFMENVLLLRRFRNKMREVNPDVYITGEIWDNVVIYSEFYRGVDSPLNFDAGNIILNTAVVGGNAGYSNRLNMLYNTFSLVNSKFVDAPFLKNHDQDRVASLPGMTLSAMKLSAEMLLTLPGSPIIYYGEELGMKGVKSSGPAWDETRRLPLKWGNSYQATWFPDTFNSTVLSVSDQLSDQDSLLSTYQRIAKVRNDNPALKYGNSFIPYRNGSYVLQGFYRAFEYEDIQQLVVVLHNFSNNDIDMPVFHNAVLLYDSKQEGVELTKIRAKSTVILELPYSQLTDITG